MHNTTTRSILYLTPATVLSNPMSRRRLAGIRRFTLAHGIAFDSCNGADVVPSNLPAILARFNPAGCIAECNAMGPSLPPSLFGAVPVVYFEAPEGPGWRGAISVAADDEAVARTAFRELAKAHPPAFAAVPYRQSASWSERRVTAFRAICAEAGAKCHVFRTLQREDEAARAVRLAKWVGALPPHVAIFAANDPAAWEVACALAAAGRNLPRSATLVGVDAIGPRWDYPSADLSSVQLDFELSGYLAARTLSEIMADTRHATCGKPSSRVACRKSRVKKGSITTFSPLLVLRRKSTGGTGRHENWIMDAVDIIRREACDGLTPASLLARFRCSRSLFDIRFKEALGHSAQDEIEHVRLERVFELLRCNTPIGSIASMCGYRSKIALRWIFRRRTGMSMREWRTRNPPR